MPQASFLTFSQKDVFKNSNGIYFLLMNSAIDYLYYFLTKNAF